MKVDAAGSSIKIYDQSTILSIELVNKMTLPHHSMDAGIENIKKFMAFSERVIMKD